VEAHGRTASTVTVSIGSDRSVQVDLDDEPLAATRVLASRKPSTQTAGSCTCIGQFAPRI